MKRYASASEKSVSMVVKASLSKLWREVPLAYVRCRSALLSRDSPWYAILAYLCRSTLITARPPRCCLVR